MGQQERGIPADSGGLKARQGTFERVFEGGLWHSRFIVLLAVVSSLIPAVILFLMVTGDLLGVAVKSRAYASNALHTSEKYDAFHRLVVAPGVEK